MSPTRRQRQPGQRPCSEPQDHRIRQSGTIQIFKPCRIFGGRSEIVGEGENSFQRFDHALDIAIPRDLAGKPVLPGNEGARQGEHMLGGDYHYQRFTRAEIRSELEAHFDVEELTGIRNIPARSIAGGLAKARLGKAGDRFLGFMTDRGHVADFWLESTPLAGAVGFFWQAKCRPK